MRLHSVEMKEVATLFLCRGRWMTEEKKGLKQLDDIEEKCEPAVELTYVIHNIRDIDA